jgi:hypothetical protein
MAELQKPNKASIYRLKVEGRLKESWSDWFNGLEIEFRTEGDQKPVTTLTGPIPDQSALLGVLVKIGNLGLRLLALELVEVEQDGGQKN